MCHVWSSLTRRDIYFMHHHLDTCFFINIKFRNSIFDDAAHKDIPLTEGRRCEEGTCCDKCSRNVFRTFASESETSFEQFPGIEQLTFSKLFLSWAVLSSALHHIYLSF